MAMTIFMDRFLFPSGRACGVYPALPDGTGRSASRRQACLQGIKERANSSQMRKKCAGGAPDDDPAGRRRPDRRFAGPHFRHNAQKIGI